MSIARLARVLGSIALAALAPLTSCAATPEYLVEDFLERQPRSVIVLRPVNQTLVAMDAEVVSALESSLRERGYAIAGAEADASLRCTMTDWSSDYSPPPYGYDSYIALEAEMIDLRTGEVIWRDRREGGDESTAEGSLVGSLIDAAVDVVFTEEPQAPISLAEKLIERMVETIPERE